MLEAVCRKGVKPRETRRTVVLQARMRSGQGWADACILNVSTRGLLVYSSSPAKPGCYVEVRRGEYAITARVMWRESGRIGLRSQDAVNLEEVISGSQASALQLGAPTLAAERRRFQRSHEGSRLAARLSEFVSLSLAGTALAIIAYATVAGALSAPLAKVTAALHGG